MVVLSAPAAVGVSCTTVVVPWMAVMVAWRDVLDVSVGAMVRVIMVFTDAVACFVVSWASDVVDDADTCLVVCALLLVEDVANVIAEVEAAELVVARTVV